MENVHVMNDLLQMQALPLSVKILMSRQRIRDWVNLYGKNNVCIWFDSNNINASRVLIHFVRSLYPEVAVVRGECDSAENPITAWMVGDDEKRIEEWLAVGCNHFEAQQPVSRPIAFWLKEDVLQYIEEVTNDSEIQ